jgi:hypothetical protein
MALAIVLNRRRQVPAEDSPAFGAIAERFRRAGDLDRAVALCQEGLQKYPKHLSSRVTLGWALLDLGRYEEARAELEQVLKRAPDNLAAIRGLAELHDRTEHDDVASMQSGPSRWAPPEDAPEQVIDDELPEYSSPETAEVAESLDGQPGPWIGLQGESEPTPAVQFQQVAGGRDAVEPPRPIFANEVSEVDALAAELLDIGAAPSWGDEAPQLDAPEHLQAAALLELVPPSHVDTDGFIPDEGPGPWPPVFEDEVSDHQALRLAHGSTTGEVWPPFERRPPVRTAPPPVPAVATAGSEFSTELAQPPQKGLLSALGRFRRRVDARRRSVEYVAG